MSYNEQTLFLFDKIKKTEKNEMSYKIYKKSYNTEYNIEGNVTIPYYTYLLTISGNKKIVMPEPKLEPTTKPHANQEEIIETELVKTGDEIPEQSLALLGLGLGAAAVARARGKQLVKTKKH